MPTNWYEIAYINYDEAILHGKTGQRQIRLTLSEDQKRAVEDMNERHQAEMQKLLHGFATQPEPAQ